MGPRNDAVLLVGYRVSMINHYEDQYICMEYLKDYQEQLSALFHPLSLHILANCYDGDPICNKDIYIGEIIQSYSDAIRHITLKNQMDKISSIENKCVNLKKKIESQLFMIPEEYEEERGASFQLKVDHEHVQLINALNIY